MSDSSPIVETYSPIVETYSPIVIDNIQFTDESVATEFSTKKNYKLVILIIASRSKDYDIFSFCWHQYMNRYPGVRSFFLFSDENLSCDLLVSNNFITYKCKESLVPGILYKTMAAKLFCHKYMNFDFLCRANLSAFIVIPRLLSFLNCQPKESFVIGCTESFPIVANDIPYKETPLIVTYKERWLRYKQVLRDFFETDGFLAHKTFHFCAGSFYVMSHDLLYHMLLEVDSQILARGNVYTLPDDIAISALFYIENIKPKNYVIAYDFFRKCTELENPMSYPDSIFVVRNKVNYGENNSRDVDVMNMVEQVRIFYNPFFLIDDAKQCDSKTFIDTV
jgi:hypothetical protein